MMSHFRTLLGGLAVLAVAACGHDPATAPTTTPTPSPIASVTISGVPTLPTVGQSAQLTAQIVRVDGTAADASGQAAWQSSDASVATVTATGVLTIAGLGEADIAATVQSVRGTVHLRSAKPGAASTLYDLEGVVHENAPTQDVLVPDATVGIHYVGCETCPHANESTTTDATGRFKLTGIATGGFALVVSKQGYETTTYGIAQLPRDQRPDITLAPDAAAVTTRFTGDLCADAAYWFPGNTYLLGQGCYSRAPLTQRHVLPVHRGGSLEITMNWVYKEDYSREFMYLDVRCGATTAEQAYTLNDYLSKYFPAPAPADRISHFIAQNNYVLEQGPLRVSVPSAALCEITPNRYSSFKSSIASTTYRIEVTHPK